MTDLDLDAITARADAANEGPWAIWHDLDYQGYKTVGDAESYATVLAGDVAEESNPAAHVYTVEDAEFIAHAREDVPALVAAVVEARDTATWAQLAADTQKERADLLQAAVNRAPHDNICAFGRMHGLPCGCWKAGL